MFTSGTCQPPHYNPLLQLGSLAQLRNSGLSQPSYLAQHWGQPGSDWKPPSVCILTCSSHLHKPDFQNITITWINLNIYDLWGFCVLYVGSLQKMSIRKKSPISYIPKITTTSIYVCIFRFLCKYFSTSYTNIYPSISIYLYRYG